MLFTKGGAIKLPRNTAEHSWKKSLQISGNYCTIEMRYNENHNPENGQFTSGSGEVADATEPSKAKSDGTLRTKSDPLREVLGAATDSHPKEVEAFRKELAESGVEIIEREYEDLAYSPGMKPGEPGQIHISVGASYGAWCHEMQHFRDDRDAGWLGFRVMKNKKTRITFERNAYSVEIELARSLGRDDIAERLEALLDEEIRRIRRQP